MGASVAVLSRAVQWLPGWNVDIWYVQWPLVVCGAVQVAGSYTLATTEHYCHLHNISIGTQSPNIPAQWDHQISFCHSTVTTLTLVT